MIKIQEFLGTKVDNSPLVVFRIFFGFLCAAESFGAILTGWVHETFIEPQFTFTFIGFEWLNMLHGEGMYFYFSIMGVMGLLIMLGLFYRVSMFTFFIMWAGVYLAQKSHYNNHYYLLMVMSAIMTIMPANKDKSLDVRFNFTTKSETCVRACIWYFILQMMVVYVYASINKMHLDWFMAKPIGIWFKYKANYWLIGTLLQEKWVQYGVAWGGVIYDGLIVFLFLYKPTRKLAFGLSLFFNLFNSFVFQIGIFPYLMIALSLFFFPGKTIRNLFYRQKKQPEPVVQAWDKKWTRAFGIYFLISVLLPLRHHLFPGDASFTEEGHRLSWRMMLRSKSGSLILVVEDKSTGERTRIKNKNYLTLNQRGSIIGQPDMIWSYAQRVKAKFAEEGKDVAVYARSSISLNGAPSKKLIDSEVDLASIPWDRWKHSSWVLYHE
ncbi:MAG: HTTM domain-containing protein [Bacteroidota bacterium]